MIFNKEAIYKFGEALKGIESAIYQPDDWDKCLDDMAKAVNGLNKQEAILVLTTKGLNDENQKDVLLKAGLITETEAESFATNKNTVAKGSNLTITEMLSAAYTRLAATMGLSTAALTTFIGVAAGVIIAAVVIEKLHISLEEAQESLEDSTTAFKETTEEIKNLNSELETTENKIKELQKLSDAGTISVADEAELKTLKEQNKELSRQIALKQRQQIIEGEEALEDARELSTKTVKSEYEFITQSQKEGTTTGAQVSVEKELDLAMEAYNESKKKYNEWSKELARDNLSDEELKKAQVNFDLEESKMKDAAARVDKMYNIINAERQAYLDLNEAGRILNSEDKERLEYLNGYNDVFLFWNHSITQTKQSFESLKESHQRYILSSRLLDENIEAKYANAIMNAISDADLSEYWDKDFSFIPPQMTDYATAEEYGKAYAEAWLNGVQSEIKKDDVDLLSITDTVDNINNKLKPTLDSLAGTYTTLFDKENGYEWQIIDVEEFASIKSELDSLKEEFGINVPTEDYEEFVKILSDTSTTSEQAQKAFDDLATSMINNSNVVELTDENFDILRNSLENLGRIQFARPHFLPQ